MRTTIDLPDAVFRELKSVAAQRGTSLKEIVCKAVEREIRTAERKNGRRAKFPLLGSKEPGTLHLTNAEIENLSS